MTKRQKMESVELERIVLELKSENHSYTTVSHPIYRLINYFPDKALEWQEIGLPVPIAHYLVQEKLLDELKYLHAKIPEALKQFTSYDESLLYTSLKFENYEIARHLLQLDEFQEFGYNFAKGGQSTLSIACDTFQSPHDIIRELVQNSKPNLAELKLSLYNAVRSGNVDAVLLLLEYDNSLLNERLNDVTGKYFLHLVIENHFNRENLFSVIWEKYYEKIQWNVIDRERATLFHSAVRFQIPASHIYALLDIFKTTFAANVNIQDGKGNTILHVAIAWHDIDVVRYCCEVLRINPRIRNYDYENGLKAAVYRASLGQWELFNDKIEYLIKFMFTPPTGTFNFAEIIDSVNLASLNRQYETRNELYPLIVNQCYLENNEYSDIIKEFLYTFEGTNARRGSYFTCFYLHDQAILYNEELHLQGRDHETNRSRIIQNLEECIEVLVYTSSAPLDLLLRVIAILRTIRGFKFDISDFINVSSLYFPFSIHNDLTEEQTLRLLEFYKNFHELNLINFDIVVRKVLIDIFCNSLNYKLNEKMINSLIFRTQLNLANKISNVSNNLKDLYIKPEFQLVQDYLEQIDFNSICHGKEIMSLKLMCRPVCRRLVLNNNVKWKDRYTAVQSLNLPKMLEGFLLYANN